MMENTWIFLNSIDFLDTCYIFMCMIWNYCWLLQILILEKVFAKLKTFEILNVLQIKPFIY